MNKIQSLSFVVLGVFAFVLQTTPVRAMCLPSQVSAVGDDALLVACSDVNATAEQIRVIIEAGADVNARDPEQGGATPLMLAVERHFDLEIGKLLVEAGADVNAKDDGGLTPLTYIVGTYRGGHPRHIGTLLDAGADAQARVKGRRAVEFVRRDGMIYSASYARLLEATYPSLEAWRTSSVADVERLIAETGLPEKLTPTGISPLMWVAGFNPDDAVVQYLLEKGLKVDASSREGFSALMLAARNTTNPQVVEVLVDAGSDLEAVDGRRGWTALMHAASANEDPAVLKWLLENGADPGSRNSNGASAIMIAAGNNRNPAVLSTLLDGGFDPNEKNPKKDERFGEMVKNGHRESGWTPLMYAARSGNREAAEVLVAAGAAADPRGNAKGRTALHFAAARSTPDRVFVGLLVEAGAKVNATDQEGNTPLMKSLGSVMSLKGPSLDDPVRNRRVDIGVIDALIAAGADLEMPNRGGVTPLMSAAVRWDESIVVRLLEAGAEIAPAVNEGSMPFGVALAAAINPNPEVLSLVIRWGARLDGTGGESGRQFGLLERAILAGVSPRAISTLLKAGLPAQPHGANGMAVPPIFAAAAKHSDPTVIGQLVAAGADPNLAFTNEDGVQFVPLEVALRDNENTVEVIAALLAAGADPNVPLADGSTLLVQAVSIQSPEGIAITRILLDAEADPNASSVDEDGRRYVALEAALENKSKNRVALVTLLLAAGADPDLCLEDGSPVLMTALAAGKEEGTAIALVFLNAGADPNLAFTFEDGVQHVPLEVALRYNEDPVKVIAALLAAGADPNVALTDGSTLLVRAVSIRRPEGIAIARILLDAGADSRINAAGGITVREIARANPNWSEVDIDEYFGPSL